MSLARIPYEVRLEAFEGPLDLLLQLVERHQLPITEVSLAKVTDSYLRRVEELGVPAEEMSHFLLVASRLLLIKSRYLLPRPEPDEEEPAGEELAEQLRRYRRFKLAAARLREREGMTSYPQLVPPPPPEPSEVISLPAALLQRALLRSLSRMPERLEEGEPVARIRVRLADYVARAERIMRRSGRVTLGELAGARASRQQMIVAFLAALDLVRRRRARAAQDGLFGPITLYPLRDGEGS